MGEYTINKYGFFKKGSGNNSADLAVFNPDELQQNTELAEQAVFLNRNTLKAKGYEVEAFNRKNLAKKSDFNNKKPNNGEQLNSGDQQVGFEAHPELPFMGGKADQLYIPGAEDDESLYQYLSEAQKDQIASKKRKEAKKLEKKLQNRMTNAPKFEIKDKPKPAPAPTIKYKSPPPRLTPFGR